MGATVSANVTATYTGFTYLITSWGYDGVSREALNTTHLSTSGHQTFIPAELIDPGTITFEILYDPAVKAPIQGAVASLALALNGNVTHTMDAFLQDFSAGAPVNELETGTCVFKISGPIIDLTYGTTAAPTTAA